MARKCLSPLNLERSAAHNQLFPPERLGDAAHLALATRMRGAVIAERREAVRNLTVPGVLRSPHGETTNLGRSDAVSVSTPSELMRGVQQCGAKHSTSMTSGGAKMRGLDLAFALCSPLNELVFLCGVRWWAVGG